MAATTDNTSTEISLVDKGIDAIKQGTALTISDLVSILSPTPAVAPVVSRVAVAKKVTEKQAEAMARVPEVFGKVVPTEPRLLQPVEIEQILDERITLDEVKKMAESRLKDITATVHNHMDREYEAQFPNEDDRAPKDKDGHYIEKRRVGVEDNEQEFSRETRGGTPTLSASALAALDTGKPDALLSHADFLSMTRMERVVDEAKIMAALKKNPRLVAALAAATEPGVPGTSMYVRKRA